MAGGGVTFLPVTVVSICMIEGVDGVEGAEGEGGDHASLPLRCIRHGWEFGPLSLTR